MDLGLTGKVALVTAASKGLGAAVAERFAREGARVVICSRDQARVQAKAEAIRQATGAEVLGVQADVTVPQQIQALVQTTLNRFGRIDVLVTNAGGPPPGTFLKLSPARWEEAVQLTLMSAVNLCYAVVPPMLEQGGGSIVAMTSVSVKQPLGNLILSNSVRMAVVGLMKTLADELGPQGIRVNIVAPGWTRTERVDQLLQARAEQKGTTPADEEAAIVANIPLRRIGRPEEFANAVVFLASPAAGYIHGVTLLVDGGMYRGAM